MRRGYIMGDTFQTECQVCEEVDDCMVVDVNGKTMMICQECYLKEIK